MISKQEKKEILEKTTEVIKFGLKSDTFPIMIIGMKTNGNYSVMSALPMEDQKAILQKLLDEWEAPRESGKIVT